MKLALIFAAAASAFAQCPAKDQSFAALMSAGGQAYKTAKFSDAGACFAQASKLDPNSIPARLDHGYALMQQYIPGDRSPANQDLAISARQRFVDVLDLDPRNTDAFASIGRLSFQQQNFDDARLWYGKLADAEPKNAEARYMLGVTGWAETNVSLTETRETLGMKLEDPGPLKDPTVREEARRVNWDRIAKSIDDLNRALALDPASDDAMAYLNLVYRQRADLQGDVAYKVDTGIAESWKNKAIAMKQRKIGQTVPK